ncbi:hypothetical protein GCM10010187_28900 [Actinomadura coerulea]|nr:hypothetical protein GCM10010187_28900 [Actinomadura coerulea]
MAAAPARRTDGVFRSSHTVSRSSTRPGKGAIRRRPPRYVLHIRPTAGVSRFGGSGRFCVRAGTATAERGERGHSGGVAPPSVPGPYGRIAARRAAERRRARRVARGAGPGDTGRTLPHKWGSPLAGLPARCLRFR